MLTMLSNFSSLWEVFTAFYCSMLIDNILGFIWTPPYKKNVKGLILNMGIPFVEILSEKLSHQLEENFNGINSHMKKKAIFMLAFCICLLILSGAEQNFGFTKDNITEICFWLSLFALIIIFTGKYTFQKYKIVFIICLLYGLSFIFLCHFGHGLNVTFDFFQDNKYILGLIILTLAIPIIWQILSIWIFSSLYYGMLKESLHEEEYYYKKAIIGIRTQCIDIVPEKYKIQAAISMSNNNQESDVSYDGCDGILYNSLDILLEPPVSVKILLSWVKHHTINRFKQKFIEDYNYINEQFSIVSQEKVPIDGLYHEGELKNESIVSRVNKNDLK